MDQDFARVTKNWQIFYFIVPAQAGIHLRGPGVDPV